MAILHLENVIFFDSFLKVPISLAVDVTPKIGLYAYNGGIHFWGTGLFNGGLTATYCF